MFHMQVIYNKKKSTKHWEYFHILEYFHHQHIVASLILRLTWFLKNNKLINQELQMFNT